MRHLFLVALLVAFPYASVSAESGPTHHAPTVQLGATPSLNISFNQFCSRDYDVVDCSNGFLVVGFQADAGIQFPFEWFALGMVGGMNFEISGAEKCSSGDGCEPVQSAYLWRVGIDARFYPLIRERALLWLAIEGGVAGSGGQAFTDVAPAVGGGLGVDFPIGRFFFIGLDIRALFFAFGRGTVLPRDADKLELTNSFWVSQGFLKLGARFSL